MKIGDLITTYHSGFFRLIRIEGDVYYYTQEFDSNCKPKKSQEKCCSKDYCDNAKYSIKTEILKMEERKQQLEKILKYVDK